MICFVISALVLVDMLTAIPFDIIALTMFVAGACPGAFFNCTLTHDRFSGDWHR